MAVQATPYVITALSHSAELFRRELQFGLPLGSAGGVMPATAVASANLTAGVAGCSDLRVNAPGSGMSVLINAGQIVVPGSLGSGSGYGIGTGYGFPTVTLNGGSPPTVASNAAATSVQLTTQGAYYCYNDNSAGQVSLVISASNATNPRIDVVIAQVEDAQYSGSNNDWKLAVVTGTAAASPTVPALPANAVRLAYVWIPANSTSVTAGNILDLRVAYNRNPFTSRVYRAGAWSTGTGGTYVAFNYDTIHYDLAAMFNVGTALFTAPVGGRYLATAKLRATSNATNQTLGCAVFKNAAQYAAGPWNIMPLNAANLDAAVSTDVILSQGDTMQIYGICSTTSVTGGTGSGDVYCSFELLNPI